MTKKRLFSTKSLRNKRGKKSFAVITFRRFFSSFTGAILSRRTCGEIFSLQLFKGSKWYKSEDTKERNICMTCYNKERREKKRLEAEKQRIKVEEVTRAMENLKN